MKRIQEHIEKNDVARVWCFWALVFCIASLLGSYAFFIHKTVLNIVARNTAEKTAAEMGSVVGEMEFRYLAEKDKITLNYALENGFNEVGDAKFISRKPRGATLSMAREL